MATKQGFDLQLYVRHVFLFSCSDKILYIFSAKPCTHFAKRINIQASSPHHIEGSLGFSRKPDVFIGPIQRRVSGLLTLLWRRFTWFKVRPCWLELLGGSALYGEKPVQLTWHVSWLKAWVSDCQLLFLFGSAGGKLISSVSHSGEHRNSCFLSYIPMSACS